MDRAQGGSLIKTLLLVVTLIPAAPALGQTDPPVVSTATKALIMTEIRNGFKLERDIVTSDLEYKNAKHISRAIEANPGKYSKAQHDAAEIALREAEAAVRRAGDAQSSAFTKAIHMTIDAYKLAPAGGLRGQSEIGHTKGRPIRWLPVARAPSSRYVESASGELMEVVQTPHGRDAGGTFQDGVTYIFEGGFDKGVEWLASTLYHESVHFEQIITAGTDDKTRAEIERDAYKKEYDARARFFDPANEYHNKLVAVIETAYHAEKNIAAQQEKERKTLQGRLAPRKPPSVFNARAANDLELGELDAFSKGISAELNAIREGARLLEERKRREAQLPKASAPREPEPPKVGKAELDPELQEAVNLNPIAAAKWVADRACRSRLSIKQFTMNAVTRNLADYIRRPDIAMSSEPNNTCAEQIYNAICEAARERMLLNADWVKTRAAQRACVDSARAMDNAYKSKLSLARKACYDGGVTSAEVNGNHEGSLPFGLNDVAQCMKDVYFLLCVGDPDGKSWNADVINAQGKAYAARDEAEKGGGSYMGGGGVTSEDRTERLQSHDFSRPNALIPRIKSPF